MDSLLFLIKKHNNNKTPGYNDKQAFIILTKTNKMRHEAHAVLYTD